MEIIRLYIRYIYSKIEFIAFHILFGIPLLLFKNIIFYIDIFILHSICVYNYIMIYSYNNRMKRKDKKLLLLISDVSHSWFKRYRRFCIILYIDIIKYFTKGILYFIKGLCIRKSYKVYIQKIEKCRDMISWKYKVLSNIYERMLYLTGEIDKLL